MKCLIRLFSKSKSKPTASSSTPIESPTTATVTRDGDNYQLHRVEAQDKWPLDESVSTWTVQDWKDAIAAEPRLKHLDIWREQLARINQERECLHAATILQSNSTRDPDTLKSIEPPKIKTYRIDAVKPILASHVEEIQRFLESFFPEDTTPRVKAERWPMNEDPYYTFWILDLSSSQVASIEEYDPSKELVYLSQDPVYSEGWY